MDCAASLFSTTDAGWAVSGEGSTEVPSGVAFTTDSGGGATRFNFAASLNHAFGDNGGLAGPESPQLELAVVAVYISHSTRVMLAAVNQLIPWEI